MAAERRVTYIKATLKIGNNVTICIIFGNKENRATSWSRDESFGVSCRRRLYKNQVPQLPLEDVNYEYYISLKSIRLCKYHTFGPRAA